MGDLRDVYQYIDAHAEETVALLMRLCRQPSISAQNVGLQEMAGLVADVLAESGITPSILPTSTGVPVVVGRLDAPGAGRTLLFYNHYDVQPPEPLELWITPPFEPAVRDGAVYARGATDNKGNIVSRLAAVQALLATGVGLSANLKFIIEGQEEISSPGLPDFFERNRDLLAADGCVWEDTMGRIDAPVVSLGHKGMCKVELRCKVGAIDSHSSYAGIYPNAIWRLLWALNTVKDQNERVLIPGFYDSVRKLSPAEQAVVAALPVVDGENLKRVRGLTRLNSNLADNEIHKRQTLEPTCNISGISGGYIGQGTKTVLPAEAMARIDMRLVPDQDPHEVADLLRKHLLEQGYDDIEVKLLGESYPCRTPVENPLNTAIANASRKVYGAEPIFEPHGAGSTPQWTVGRYLGMPCSATGVGYVTSMTHAPNENIRIDQLIEGAKFMATIIDEFGRT